MTSVNPLDRRDWQACDMGVAWLRYGTNGDLTTRTTPVITFVHGWGRVAGLKLDPYRYRISNLWLRQGRRTYTGKLVWYVTNRVNSNITTTFANLAGSVFTNTTTTSPFYRRTANITQGTSGSATLTSVKVRTAGITIGEPPEFAANIDVFVARI